jgi:hypothetical protein
MSSTSNVQNFLVNVFRPVYTYDPTTTTFTPKLELSNIDTYSGNTVSVFTAAIGDGSNNVYVGSNAGNSYTTIKACRNVTAVGYSAGSNISNVSNSTYVGFEAGKAALSASNVVAIGANTNGNGISNVYVGTGAGSGGNSNVFLGAGTTGTGSSSILIGPGLSDASSNSVFKLGQTYLTGNMSTKWLGLGTTSPYDPYNKMDISGNLYVFGQQGLNTVPSRTLDVNGDFHVSDGGGSMDVSGGLITSTNGFVSRQGTISNAGAPSSTTVGTLKKGIIAVSAQHTASASHYESIMAFCIDPTDGSTAVDMTSNVQLGDVTVVFQSGGSNIQISNVNTIKTISWSVTYFPLP